MTGKSLSFPYPTAGTPQFLFGTDGGAGNFLRMMEDWNQRRRSQLPGLDGQPVSPAGRPPGRSNTTASHNVYDYADRNFKFDSEFLQPALLPPGTPMFRDVNLLTFRQILRPNQ